MPERALTGDSPGLYGKLPGRGDFVSRRLPRGFIDPWDAWLQAALVASRAALGPAWLDAWLNGPIWRFGLSAGLCGDAPAAGLLMPSVDRVGRYFPLTIAVPLPDCRAAALLPLVCGEWFAAAEEILLTALDEPFDFDAFDARVAAAGRPGLDMVLPGDMVASPGPLRLSLPDDLGAAEACARIADRALAAACGACSVWRRAGPPGPNCLVYSGLPPAEDFAAFLDGCWSRPAGLPAAVEAVR